MLNTESAMVTDAALHSYFRCPEQFASFRLTEEVKATAEFFRFGEDLLCYGRTAGQPRPESNGKAEELLRSVVASDSVLALPFSPSEVAANLRHERYVPVRQSTSLQKMQRQIYYWMRPLLGVSVRKHLQRAALRNWEQISFPAWPVDRTVDRLFEKVLELSMRAHGVDTVPFIWFWPDGHRSCAIMTHDVEDTAGVNRCELLMDMNTAFAVPASFQFIPERRYQVSSAFLDHVRQRGFEVNVHDLNHDGHLFDDREEFARRAAKINAYARSFGSTGFRSAVLYRNLAWYGDFEFSYDMSVPNVAHLDPQRGGCCTVMPFFVDDVLELPLTTTQDYSLFNILEDYSIDLWKRQIRTILDGHGLISFNIHPDYICDDRSLGAFTALLRHLAALREEKRIVMMSPGEADRWWRERHQMSIHARNGRLQIEGPNHGRARIALARLTDGGLHYEFYRDGREEI